MQPEDDSKPVSHAYLREVLIRVDKSLQEYSAAISKLQSGGSTDLDPSRVEEIERRVNDLHQRIQEAVRDDKGDDRSQSNQQQIQRIETRLDQLERLEKTEEYEQNNLERDVQQLQRDFESMERKIRDIEYKLQRL